MKLTNYTLRFPAIVICIFSVITLIGLLLIPQMNIQNLPNISEPFFTIEVNDQGLSANSIDYLITQPIQKWIQSIPDISFASGQSYNGFSFINVAFKIGTDLNQAYLNLQRRLNEMEDTLPKKASKPILKQLNVAGAPDIWILVESMHLSPIEISNLIQHEILHALRSISGVAKIEVIGEVPNRIIVDLDQNKMSALGIPLALVYSAFQKENILLPGGAVEHHKRQYFLSLDLQLPSLNAIHSLVLTVREGKPIYLHQVANVHLQQNSRKEKAYFNMHPVIALGVLSEINANTLNVIKAVKETINQLQKKLPNEVKLATAFSQKNAIETSAYSLFNAIILALICSSIVVYLFLGSLRLSGVIMMIVPISLLAAVIAMFIGNLSFNVLTLLMLVLLICIVVDDAIIVIENYISDLHTKPETLGIPLVCFSLNRISSSIIAYTISLCIIFLSAVFTQGLVSIFFKDISIVMISGVVVSAAACLTLTPLLCQRFIYKLPGENCFTRLFNNRLQIFQSYYLTSLSFLQRHKLIVLVFIVCLFIPLPFALGKIDKNLFPTDKEFTHLMIQIRTLDNVPNSTFNQYLLSAEKIVNAHPGVSYTLAYTDENMKNQGEIITQLKPEQERQDSALQIMQDLQNQLDSHAGFLSYVRLPPIFPGAKEPLHFIITGKKHQELRQLETVLKILFHQHPDLGKVYSSNIPLQPSYELKIDRYTAAKVGLTAEEIADAVSLYGGDIHAGKTYLEKYKNEYDIYLYSTKKTLDIPKDLEKIYVYNRAGKAINLTSVARINVVANPDILQSFNGQPALEFYSTPEIALSKANDLLMKIITPVLAPDQELHLIGQSKQLKEDFSSLGIAIVIAILLLYVALVAQFNSFSLPFILLIAQPIAIAFVIYLLYFTGIGLNIFSLIGLFLLIGIKTKNFILLITAMNHHASLSKDISTAVISACRERFRPIIMTSTVVILTVMPTLFTHGVDKAKNVALGGTLLMGIITSTVFSLFFVPLTFPLFKKNKNE
ncbi:efflux RND transporter permease subunit [Legionella nagasakiensis]|uniref:efflux RND transporter permease subunit n=1 Tax=Legionella nagasakiensis TaxID=535290 RepID=UPI0010553580|nr:efflux RND transporter permease subunit [Legionella nagasakiensis]